MKNIYQRLAVAFVIGLGASLALFTILFLFTLQVMPSAQFHAISSVHDWLSFLPSPLAPETLILVTMCMLVSATITLLNHD